MATDLAILSTYVLAVSTANERLVALIKTLVPWLSEKPVDATGLFNSTHERRRAFVLQLITLAVAMLSTYLLTEKGGLKICIDPKLPDCYDFWVIGLLSLGGTAFWNSILGYANALKDVKREEVAEKRLQVAARAQQLNVTGKRFAGN